DVTPPNVSFISPADFTNATSGIVLLNVTVTDSVTNVTHVIFNITNSTGFLLFNASVSPDVATQWNFSLNTSNLAEEVHTIRVFANDSLNNQNTTVTRTLTVDRTAPTVTLVTLNSSFFATTTPSLAFNYTDSFSGVANCTLFVNSSVSLAVSTSNHTTYNRTTTFLVPSALGEGNHTYLFQCTDRSGNAANSSLNLMTVDTLNPGVAILSPSDASFKNVSFNLSVTATNATNVSYRLENGSTVVFNYTPLASSGVNFWNLTFNVTSVANGNYTLRINATDSANNSNASVTIQIALDTTAPTVTVACDDVDKGESAICTCTRSDNSQSFNGTVNLTDFTIPSTSTTGNKTATCTVVDSAGNYANASDVFAVSGTSTSSSSSGGVGGGGGGSSTNVIAKTSKTWSTVAADTEATLTNTNSKIAVTSIVVVFDSTVNNAGLDVSSVTKPSSVTVPTGTVFQYLTFTPKNMLTDNIASATVMFRVPLSWFMENNVLRSGVLLLRYTNGVWTDLSTKEVRTDASYAYFEATTPGFSTFAIVSRDPSTAGQEAPVEEPAADSGDAAAPVEDTPVVDDTAVPEDGEKKPFNWMILGYVIAGLAVLGGLVAFFAKSRN
ncbi:MAG: PGF-pre-PGF domain-containing protein, partial [Nanoarchaeota archaeon]|nr:PGF-pre-PGF domain-containing protein [Nanoarchaeota archaeon]